MTCEPAWHKLGTVIEQAASSVETIGLAGLDWAVEQWPARAFDPNHPQQEATAINVVANVRSDTRPVLGIVSRRYLFRFGLQRTKSEISSACKLRVVAPGPPAACGSPSGCGGTNPRNGSW